jgi:hypothetical protein
VKNEQAFENPFKPGAGHMPPYLAGREGEIDEFERLLEQRVILENLVLTGLRGVGKTVLLETFKPLAMRRGWLWVGTDLSEAASVSESSLALRLLTDLSVVTSTLPGRGIPRVGFEMGYAETSAPPMDFEALTGLFQRTPGLVEDKLKAVLEGIWQQLEGSHHQGLIFAYDEAQNLADRHQADQYPLSLLLDLFQSLQRKNIPFMLLLTGLPTLFPKLVEARTFSERMFRVVTLDRLDQGASREAIQKPIEQEACSIVFTSTSVDTIRKESGGYPYFVQFICREVFDILSQQIGTGLPVDDARVPFDAIIRKLDTDFFAGRWAKPTDRQRELLRVIASLEGSGEEFTVQEIVALSSRILDKGFSSSHVNQMLVALADMGLVYKNRHGKYSFAVPLFGDFILRQMRRDEHGDPAL